MKIFWYRVFINVTFKINNIVLNMSLEENVQRYLPVAYVQEWTAVFVGY